MTMKAYPYPTFAIDAAGHRVRVDATELEIEMPDGHVVRIELNATGAYSDQLILRAEPSIDRPQDWAIFVVRPGAANVIYVAVESGKSQKNS